MLRIIMLSGTSLLYRGLIDDGHVHCALCKPCTFAPSSIIPHIGQGMMRIGILLFNSVLKAMLAMLKRSHVEGNSASFMIHCLPR